MIVSAPPEIFYAEDTDGDGKADIHVTLFTGFREGNQQHRANGFDYGLDNWVYGANGESGGTVRSQITGREVNIRGRDFRFRPDDGAFETQAGQTQFGRHRDDWGNWFGNNNSQGSWHYFLPEQYLARNPYLAANSTRQVMPNYPDYERVFPISRLAQRFNDPGAANHLTSANSTSPYRDDLFGPEFATSYFVSEPVHNLVHREILEQDGVSFTSHRAADEKEIEFLASSDNWFRPAMTKTGPDGALYVADVYRLVIEHPEWIPLDFQQSVDLRAGASMGRIYRVYPEGATLRKTPRLDNLDTASLAAAMESPNGWQRDTVQRLLVERADKSAAAPLQDLVGHSPNPKTRLQALCALDGLGALTPEILIQALKDPHPAVREQAIRVSEPWLDKSSKLDQALLRLIADSNVRVRYQLAFSLGEWHSPRAGHALAQIALGDPTDARMRTAVMSSATHNVKEMIATVLEHQEEFVEGGLMQQLVGLAAALNDQPALLTSVNAIARARNSHYESWQFATLAGLLDALDQRKMTLDEFRSTSSGELKESLQALENLFVQARKTALDMQSSDAERTAAIRLLGRGLAMSADEFEELRNLLGPQNCPGHPVSSIGQFGLGCAEIASRKLSSPPGRAAVPMSALKF